MEPRTANHRAAYPPRRGRPGYRARTLDGDTVTIVATRVVDGELRLVGSDGTEYRHAPSSVDNRLRPV